MNDERKRELHRLSANELLAEVERLDQALEEAQGPHCSRCGNAIDPDTCHCGSPTDDHTIGSGHSPVPMGCDCHRDDTDWHKVASVRALALAQTRVQVRRLEAELFIARGLNVGDRQRIDRLESDLREATDTLATAKSRIEALEAALENACQLARRLLALAGAAP